MAQLSGTYSIDAGGSGDYASIGAAIADLQALGQSGAVTLDVVSGSGPYTEQLLLKGLGSPSTPITIDGHGETLQFSPTVSDAKHVVRIDSSSSIEIKNLSIAVPVGAAQGWGIHLKNRAAHITVSNCQISSGNTNAFSFEFGGIVATNSNSSLSTVADGPSAFDVHIQDTDINNVTYGILMNGSPDDHASGLIVERCSLTNIIFRGIKSIWLDDIEIYDSYINWIPGTGNVGSQGINLDRGAGLCNLERNELPRTGQRGILVFNHESTAANPVRIKNNLIGGGCRNNYFLTEGINVFGDTVEIHHNTVVHDLGGGSCVSAGGNAVDIRNNSFTSKLGPTAPPFGVYGTALNAPNLAGLTSLDYNNYYVEGGNLVAKFGGNDYSTLADLQADPAGPAGHDLNSVSVEPMPVSQTNLRETGTNLDGLAIPGLALVDVDGEARDPSTPDLGADEHDPSAACSTPLNPAVSVLMPSSVTLTWDAVPGAISYEVQGRRAGLGGPKTLSTLGNSVVVNVVVPNTAYEWRLRALCATSTSDYTGVQTFTTPSLRLPEQATLSPNPTKGLLAVNAEDGTPIQVHSLDGRLMGTYKVVAGRLDLSDVPDGTYMLGPLMGAFHRVVLMRE